MQNAQILWRRLDMPGHDSCRLMQLPKGWRLEGMCAFRHESGESACAHYQVDSDTKWRTVRAELFGWVGERRVDLQIARDERGWRRNGKVVQEVDGCLDLDLGFTPATNLFQLQRLALQSEQAAYLSVAWLDLPDGELSVLKQRYQRRNASTYDYEAPQFDFRALLEIGPEDFIYHYPGLWRAESA